MKHVVRYVGRMYKAFWTKKFDWVGRGCQKGQNIAQNCQISKTSSVTGSSMSNMDARDAVDTVYTVYTVCTVFIVYTVYNIQTAFHC